MELIKVFFIIIFSDNIHIRWIFTPEFSIERSTFPWSNLKANFEWRHYRMDSLLEQKAKYTFYHSLTFYKSFLSFLLLIVAEPLVSSPALYVSMKWCWFTWRGLWSPSLIKIDWVCDSTANHSVTHRYLLITDWGLMMTGSCPRSRAASR